MERQNGESVVDYLKRLDESGRYLFHGSPYGGLKILEPRKADDASGGEWGNDTAVYAVRAIIAAGRAIMPKRETLVGTWSISSDRDPLVPGGPKVRITSNIVPMRGSVYALDKNGFISNPKSTEWKSKEPVSVLAEIIVTPEDYVSMGGGIVISENANRS